MHVDDILWSSNSKTDNQIMEIFSNKCEAGLKEITWFPPKKTYVKFYQILKGKTPHLNFPNARTWNMGVGEETTNWLSYQIESKGKASVYQSLLVLFLY